MCNIIGPYNETKEFTGYKVVIVDDYGHYYSPFTGIRYQIGNVIPPKDITQLKSKYRFKQQAIGYTKDMNGYTGVFINKYSADWLLDILATDAREESKFKLKIIKMTITGNLKNAAMGFLPQHYVIIGKFITTMSSK